MSDEKICKSSGHVAQLAGIVGSTIFDECHSCFSDVQRGPDLSLTMSANMLPRLLELAVILNAHHAAAYNRRIVTFLFRLAG